MCITNFQEKKKLPRIILETTTKILLSKGIKVKLAKGFVSTPMVSYGVVSEGANLGIVILIMYQICHFETFLGLYYEHQQV